jgi:hypothetical protein
MNTVNGVRMFSIWESKKNGKLITVIGNITVPELNLSCKDTISFCSEDKGILTFSIEKFKNTFKPYKK